MSHPRHELDAVIHLPVRFSIVAALSAVERAEFGFVRDTVEVSDSLLSQHLTTLERAGYVKVTKRQVGRRSRTWLSLTPDGRTALARHLALLNEIAAPVTGDQGTEKPVNTGRDEQR
jgi:DNA-binding MarR family transcriptional regulator